ncbi:MAG: hypothetical protein R3343_11060 [Nitriliruptorales bacterium]|nr:hypothetical protein [Nitriliruptorales bacterium]
MRKLITMLAAVAMLGGSAALATAHPGPHHGQNAFGLCTAYFAGSDQGQENKRQAPPFQALEQAAEDSDQTVEEWCEENAPHPSGNGNGNGRS